MLKKWYILLERGKQEGPFTLLELRYHPLVTPDTFVWRQGMEGWKQIRYVSELKEIFADRPESVPVEDLIKPKFKKKDLIDKQEVLTLQRDPMQFFIWIFILLILILIYLYYDFRFFQ